MGTLDTDFDRALPRDGPGGTAEFTNRIPSFLWAFVFAWCAVLAAATGLVLGERVPEGIDPPAAYGILAIFWFAAIALLSLALATPCVRAVVVPGRVDVSWRYPLATVRASFRASDLEPATVVDSVDSDGDRYFSVVVRAGDARSFTLEEGHHRPGCEATARRFNAVAGLAGRPR